MTTIPRPDTSRLGPPLHGHRLTRAIGHLLLRLWRWRITGELPALPRFVIIVAPHTSNWDFPVGAAAKFALGLQAHWFGKDTLFRGPLGVWMRHIGGEPVDRAAPGGVVGAAVARIRATAQYVLALSPEGTRRRVTRWRTGFHAIARGAGIPIVPVALDWSRREVRIGDPFWPTDDLAADLPRLAAFYDASMAHTPALYADPVME